MAGWVLHAHSREYHWEGVQPLSIKTFYGGAALYATGRGTFRVDEGSYLILNHDQPYAIEVSSERSSPRGPGGHRERGSHRERSEAIPIESLCLFFDPGVAEDVHRTLTAPTGHLLDAPRPPERALPFVERTYPHDDVLSPALFRFKAAYPARRDDPGWVTEQLHALAGALVYVHQRVRDEIDALPAVRAATREELYRRLHRARDYILACTGEPLTLSDLAREAALSPNHFLRTFRQAFGRSPHQFLTGARLTRAAALLRTTELPVTEICLVVGFQSLGSFSTLFRRRFGASPAAYRRKR